MQPRTKRWAEAKVLADCTAQKVCPLASDLRAGRHLLHLGADLQTLPLLPGYVRCSGIFPAARR